MRSSFIFIQQLWIFHFSTIVIMLILDNISLFTLSSPSNLNLNKTQKLSRARKIRKWRLDQLHIHHYCNTINIFTQKIFGYFAVSSKYREAEMTKKRGEKHVRERSALVGNALKHETSNKAFLDLFQLNSISWQSLFSFLSLTFSRLAISRLIFSCLDFDGRLLVGIIRPRKTGNNDDNFSTESRSALGSLKLN